MNVNELIEAFEQQEETVYLPYIMKNIEPLLRHYRSKYNCEPLLVISEVFEGDIYAFLIPETDYHKMCGEWLSKHSTPAEEIESELEAIKLLTTPLKDFSI